MGLPLVCATWSVTLGQGWCRGAGGGCNMQPALFRCCTHIFQEKENPLFFFSTNFFESLVSGPKSQGLPSAEGGRLKRMGKHGKLNL